MPFIHFQTNCPVDDATSDAMKTAFGAEIATIPGKSEAWLMVKIEQNCKLYFQGTDAPAAIAEVSIYGKADRNALETLTGKICATAQDLLAVPPERVYVKYTMTPDWGWNGSNF